MKLLVPSFFLAILSSAGFAASPQKVIVPLVLEGHRIFLDAQFTRKDGTLRTARLWLDSGTPDFQISKGLAQDLGLDLSGPTIKSGDGVQQVQVQLPGLQIDGLTVDLQGAKPMVIIGPQQVFAGARTDGNLPATVLVHYQVVLDIPHRRMTLAQPGGLKPKGTRLPCLLQPQTGMVQFEATIDGQQYSLALDSGAPYSMISTQALQEWGIKHRDWARIVGAAGAANMLEIPNLLRAPMMRIPLIHPAGVALKDVGVLGMGPEFVSWYSKKTATPVIGFLAWNVLQAYRITIDYPASSLYFEKEGNINLHEMDGIGLTLAHSRSGGYAILAVVQKDGKPVVDGVQPGDKLLKVDDLNVTQVDLQTVVEALQGSPGGSHVLVLDRKGVTFTIRGRVVRLI